MYTKLYNLPFEKFLNLSGYYRMIFADPPDGIGLKYSDFKDKIPNYEDFLRTLICLTTLKCDIMWLSLNAKHVFVAGKLIMEFLDYQQDKWEVKPCVQIFTFSQNNHYDLGNGHRPLYRLMRKGTVIYPNAIRIPSWRQENGDKRADPRGKVPNDVFDFPRVTGNSKQRRAFSPTQLHEGLYERCIKLSCAPEDVAVDLFAGSGTLGRVAKRCNINGIMVEISRKTCDAILTDQPWTKEVKYEPQT